MMSYQKGKSPIARYIHYLSGRDTPQIADHPLEQTRIGNVGRNGIWGPHLQVNQFVSMSNTFFKGHDAYDFLWDWPNLRHNTIYSKSAKSKITRVIPKQFARRRAQQKIRMRSSIKKEPSRKEHTCSGCWAGGSDTIEQRRVLHTFGGWSCPVCQLMSFHESTWIGWRSGSRGSWLWDGTPFQLVLKLIAASFVLAWPGRAKIAMAQWLRRSEADNVGNILCCAVQLTCATIQSKVY